MTSSQIQQLFEQTLVGDYDDEAAWDAVSKLQGNGSLLVFQIAADWLKSTNPVKRARAAAVLAQLRAPNSLDENWREPEWLFREETFSRLIDLLNGESDAMVLSSGVAALGHLYNEAAVPMIVRYKDFPDENVRFSVAFSLGCFPNNSIAVSALISLASDPDSNVRDWAIFGLGVQGSVDAPEIRETFLQALADSDEDVREEAAVSLGKRQDIRLLPTLRRMLEAPELKGRVAEAASAMLGLPEDSEEWVADDYKKALARTFGMGEQATTWVTPQVKELLDNRYDDLKSGRVELVSSEQVKTYLDEKSSVRRA